MATVDLANVAILRTERRSFANCRLEGTVFKRRGRTVGNQTIEGILRAVATPSAARCDFLESV